MPQYLSILYMQVFVPRLCGVQTQSKAQTRYMKPLNVAASAAVHSEAGQQNTYLPVVC